MMQCIAIWRFYCNTCARIFTCIYRVSSSMYTVGYYWIQWVYSASDVSYIVFSGLHYDTLIHVHENGASVYWSSDERRMQRRNWINRSRERSPGIWLLLFFERSTLKEFECLLISICNLHFLTRTVLWYPETITCPFRKEYSTGAFYRFKIRLSLQDAYLILLQRYYLLFGYHYLQEYF